jgi:predicted chitinase
MLDNIQTQNAQYLKQAAAQMGLTNPYVQSAILGVVFKESGLKPKSELSYANTSNEQIRKTFKNVRTMDDAKLNVLKKNPEAFFNAVYYNPVLGNGPSDGFKYRGRGFNQLTGKSNYAAYAKLSGIDIVNNPDKLNEPDTAAKVAVAFFKRGLERGKSSGILSKYNASDINDFKDNANAYEAIYQINAGKLGKPLSLPSELIKKGYERGKSVLDYFNKNIVGINNAVLGAATNATEVVKKNPLKITLLITATVLGIILLVKAIKTDKK